jgi:hypothetical protein
MYNLVFNGYFELSYPNEFLADLKELMQKHNCSYFGQFALKDLGTYIDFQEAEIKDA